MGRHGDDHSDVLPSAKDLSPTKIDPALSARLGDIVIKWSSIEEWIGYLIATMTDGEPGAMSVVTGEMSSSLSIQIVRTLISIHEHKEPELAKLRELVDRADRLREERNEYVHGIWDSTDCEPDTCLVSIFNWKRAEITRTVLVTVSDLDNLAVELDNWVADYVALGKQMNFPRRRGETKSIFLDTQ